MRSSLLWLAGNPRAERLVRSMRFSRPLVQRFIAGEDLDSALQQVREINSRRMSVTLDLLGENVHEQAQAGAASAAYVDMLDRIQATGVNSNISIKLTMLGLDFSNEFAWQNLEPVIAAAKGRDNFVRIDMEGSAYTERTLDLFRRAHDAYPESVGIVLQSYLYRTDRDVEEMIERRARVRIVKGAYNEPDTVAYPRKPDVDDAYRRHIERLLEAGNYPAIATHDDAIIRMAQGYALRMGIERSRYEFQMLYGVRRELQQSVASAGDNLRIYVPYGRSWYPYFMRRIAERPANLFFVLRQIVDR